MKLKKQFFDINFTQTPNQIINEASLSLKGKGLWSYIWSKPDNWDFAMERIALENEDGVSSIRSGIKELETKGFLVRIKLPSGRMEYHIFYEPTCGFDMLAKSQCAKKPTCENRMHNKEIVQITNNNNKEIDIIKPKIEILDAPDSSDIIILEKPEEKYMELVRIWFSSNMKSMQAMYPQMLDKKGILLEKIAFEWGWEFEKIERLDGFSTENQKILLAWFFGNAKDACFWRENIRTPMKLRKKKDTQSPQYWRVVAEKAAIESQKQKQKSSSGFESVDF